MKRETLMAVVAFGVVGCTGCVAGIVPAARYTSISAASSPPTRTIALKVVDDREPKLGGLEKNLVGQARGGYGNPFGVRENRTDTVANLVRAATVDALILAGVGVAESDHRTLVATVKKYWSDGFMGYKTDIEVSYELLSPEGTVLWRAPVRAQQTGGLGMKPQTKMKKMYEEALQGLAKNAASEFKTAEFRRNIGAGAEETAGAGAKLYSKDGTYFGEVVGTLGDNVVVTLANGVRATIALSQAAEMMRSSAPIERRPAPELAKLRSGVKLYAADGRLVGDVASVDGDVVLLNLDAGGQIKATRDQAMKMLEASPGTPQKRN